jgi:hypothetical protein
MVFKIDRNYREEMTATEDIPVFKILNSGEYSLSHYCKYKVGELNPEIDLIAVGGEIAKGYFSSRVPNPGYFRFVIPKGSKYYYTTNDSLWYISSNIRFVSKEPLTEEECVELCNFPKTYVEACERLGIKPLDEDLLIGNGLDSADIALKKLQTVIKSINIQYGIEKYDWENRYQDKWYGSFILGANFIFASANYRSIDTYSSCSSHLYLPFELAVKYVCDLNEEFFEYWETYLQ